jgi:hypothetical protein
MQFGPLHLTRYILLPPEGRPRPFLVMSERTGSGNLMKWQPGHESRVNLRFYVS